MRPRELIYSARERREIATFIIPRAHYDSDELQLRAPFVAAARPRQTQRWLYPVTLGSYLDRAPIWLSRLRWSIHSASPLPSLDRYTIAADVNDDDVALYIGDDLAHEWMYSKLSYFGNTQKSRRTVRAR